jgi:UDP-GlcNAc:undecaprenyl-phosphate GlcNAc-1-phosphate transferase
LDHTLAVDLLFGPLIAFIFTAGLIIWLRPIARASGLVDVPDARKVHTGEVPLIGGLAIFISVFAAMITAGIILPDQNVSGDFAPFYLAGMLLILVGALDDIVDLSPAKKFAVQIGSSLIMIYGSGVVLIDLGALNTDGTLLLLGSLSVPFTVFATIGVINAVNMSDGLDGLAGSLSLVSLLGFIAAYSIFGNNDQNIALLGILAAAVSGFLVFNFRFPGRPGASVFLGDSGSMFLGFTLAWFAIKFSQGESRVIAPSAALWFLVVPLFDTVAITTRRDLKRRPPFGADREHLHHIFLLAGFTETETVLIMAGFALGGVFVGIAGTYFNVPEYILGGAFLIAGLFYLWMIVHSWSVMSFLKRSINRRTTVEDRRGNGDRRKNVNVAHLGPERRSSVDRRKDSRRKDDATNETSSNQAEKRSLTGQR